MGCGSQGTPFWACRVGMARAGVGGGWVSPGSLHVEDTLAEQLKLSGCKLKLKKYHLIENIFSYILSSSSSLYYLKVDLEYLVLFINISSCI